MLSPKDLAQLMTAAKNYYSVVKNNPRLVKKMSNKNKSYSRLANVIRTAPRRPEVGPFHLHVKFGLTNLKRKNVKRGKLVVGKMGGLQNVNRLGSYTGRSIRTPTFVAKVPNKSYLHIASKAAQQLKIIRNMKKRNFYSGNNNNSGHSGRFYHFKAGNNQYLLEASGELRTGRAHGPLHIILSGVRLSDMVSKSNRKKFNKNLL